MDDDYTLDYDNYADGGGEAASFFFSDEDGPPDFLFDESETPAKEDSSSSAEPSGGGRKARRVRVVKKDSRESGKGEAEAPKGKKSRKKKEIREDEVSNRQVAESATSGEEGAPSAEINREELLSPPDFSGALPRLNGDDPDDWLMIITYIGRTNFRDELDSLEERVLSGGSYSKGRDSKEARDKDDDEDSSSLAGDIGGGNASWTSFLKGSMEDAYMQACAQLFLKGPSFSSLGAAAKWLYSASFNQFRNFVSRAKERASIAGAISASEGRGKDASSEAAGVTQSSSLATGIDAARSLTQGTSAQVTEEDVLSARQTVRHVKRMNSEGKELPAELMEEYRQALDVLKAYAAQQHEAFSSNYNSPSDEELERMGGHRRT